MDDYPDAANTLAAVVESLGYEPHVAYDAETALELAQIISPAIFILDLALPVSSGYDVAQQLRGKPQFENAFMVALTGFNDQTSVKRAVSSGFDIHNGSGGVLSMFRSN